MIADEQDLDLCLASPPNPKKKRFARTKLADASSSSVACPHVASSRSSTKVPMLHLAKKRNVRSAPAASSPIRSSEAMQKVIRAKESFLARYNFCTAPLEKIALQKLF